MLPENAPHRIPTAFRTAPDEHDFATSYALQAPEFRKLVHFGESSVQPEA
jgi:hypothetical protein